MAPIVFTHFNMLCATEDCFGSLWYEVHYICRICGSCRDQDCLSDRFIACVPGQTFYYILRSLVIAYSRGALRKVVRRVGAFSTPSGGSYPPSFAVEPSGSGVFLVAVCYHEIIFFFFYICVITCDFRESIVVASSSLE